MPNQTGKRYVCERCNSEMLVTRGGDGELQCCGQPRVLRAAAKPGAAQPKAEANA